MKIRNVTANNRRKAFAVETFNGKVFTFPYARTGLSPTRDNPIEEVFVDKELGNEAFTYLLRSGDENSIHIDSVLEHNKDPEYMAELLVYKLSLEAQKAVEQADISKRQIIELLGTSPSQFYRLLDEKNTRASLSQMAELFHVLGHELTFEVRKKKAGSARLRAA
jgi:predicted XRE-type DNA-binding protein